MCIDVASFEQKKHFNSQIYQSAIDSAAAKSLSPDFVSKTGLTRSDIFDKLGALKNCADYIELVAPVNEPQKTTVRKATFCKNPHICGLCAGRLQVTRRGKYTEKFIEMAKKYPYAYLVTWTVSPRQNLGDQLEHLKKSMQRFRKMGQKRQSRGGRIAWSRGEWSRVRAAAVSYEVKRGKSGQWHAHAHGIVFTDSLFDFRLGYEYTPYKGKTVALSKLSTEWLRASGDSININCQLMQKVPRNAKHETKKKLSKMSYPESIAYQAREVTKYTAKLNPAAGSDLIDIIVGTHTRRMFATFGDLRGFKDSYLLDEKDKKTSYYLLYDVSLGQYEPVPGYINKYPAHDILFKKACREMSLLQAKYRMQRKERIAQGGRSVALDLDYFKKVFRSKISRIWRKFRLDRGPEYKQLTESGRQQLLFSAAI